MADETFEWDRRKNIANQEKHGVSFDLAQHAFADPERIAAKNKEHSKHEQLQPSLRRHRPFLPPESS